MIDQLDVVVLVPFQPYTGHAVEPLFRQSVGSRLYPHILRGYGEFARFVGRDLLFRGRHRPAFGDEQAGIEFTAHRSLTAVALATHLERAGLRWHVIDPGQQEIRWWRKQLETLRPRRPRAVGVSTTFTVGGKWLRALCAMVRDVLPDTRVVLGGYYYTSDAADFLSIDADVYCIGEGELRFERIVAAIRDGTPLDGIPGLYLRRSRGALHSTGKAPQSNLDDLAPPDWRLAERIDPPVSLERDFIDIALETQRGCVFKCEFCTYRTLARPDFMSTDVAADRIAGTASIPRAIVRITDSTATFPHARWGEMMRKLVDRGGSPHPLWAYARVNDIDEESAALMEKAGVREVFIGQESGDERILSTMKKGTHVKQVRPALEALQRHGLWAFVSFIHGFPGETPDTIRATRQMITTLNEGFPEDRPAVGWYNVNPFLTQDFASVTEKTNAMEKGYRYLGFDEGDGNSSKRMAEECLATMLAAARVPHAPVFVHVLTLLTSPARGAVEPEPSLCGHPHRYAFQRWLKAVERGIAIFMERELEGTPVNLTELKRLREQVLSRYSRRPGRLERLAVHAVHRVTPAVGAYIQKEWLREETEGIGPATRLGLAALAFRDTGRLSAAVRAIRNGEYYPTPAPERRPHESCEAARNLAIEAIQDARDDVKRVVGLVRRANSKTAPAA